MKTQAKPTPARITPAEAISMIENAAKSIQFVTDSIEAHRAIFTPYEFERLIDAASAVVSAAKRLEG